MSQVNFVEQFNYFMLYARRNKLTSYERTFYLGLFYCANDLARQTENYEWPDDYFPVNNVELSGWTGFDERAIRNTRNSLKQKGLLDFRKGDGRKSDPEYCIYYLQKIGYKIVPDVPKGEATGDENAAGQGIGDENAADEKQKDRPAAKTQPIAEETAAKTQPIEETRTETACEFAPDYVGDTVGDAVGDAVAIDSKNAADHFIKNKLNVNVNANINADPPPAKGRKEPTEAPAAAPLGNPELGKVLSFYQDHFGFAPPLTIAGLTDFTASLGADVVIHAMDIAASEKKSSWSYIRGILNRYQREGLRTMADVRLSEQRFEESKARKNSKRQEPEAPRGGGLVDLSASYSGPQGLVSGLDRGW